MKRSSCFLSLAFLPTCMPVRFCYTRGFGAGVTALGGKRGVGRSNLHHMKSRPGLPAKTGNRALAGPHPNGAIRYALNSLLDAIQAGSFAEVGLTLVSWAPASRICYFGLATLLP